MSEKWRRSETCTVIFNDKLQGSIAKHLRSDDLLNYTFITQSPNEGIFLIGEHLAKLQAKEQNRTGKMVIVSRAPFALHFCSQRC